MTDWLMALAGKILQSVMSVSSPIDPFVSTVAFEIDLLHVCGCGCTLSLVRVSIDANLVCLQLPQRSVEGSFFSGMYRVGPKLHTKLMAIILSNVNRFSQFFHC